MRSEPIGGGGVISAQDSEALHQPEVFGFDPSKEAEGSIERAFEVGAVAKIEREQFRVGRFVI